MNKNIIIVFIGAVVIAVLVAVLVQFSLKTKQPPAPIASAPQIEVLVAAKNLQLGKTLEAGDMRWQKWPADSVFSGLVKRDKNERAEKALEGRLARAVSSGEPMLKSALLSNTQGNIVAASLEKGQRAVSIGVSATSMVSGFITPGDHVDVVLTYKENIDDGGDDMADSFIAMNLDKLAVETILQNVKVLAVDQLAKSPKDNKVKVGRTVTLAVDLERAETLALASEIGTLNLVLRGVGDDAEVAPSWPINSDARLTKMDDDVLARYREHVKATGGDRRTIKIYNGNALQSVVTQ